MQLLTEKSNVLRAIKFLSCRDASLTVTQNGAGEIVLRGEGLFVLMVQGRGLLLVSSFGAIHRKPATANATSVDTGHLVAWEGTTQ